jgi:hypothetical protein
MSHVGRVWLVCVLACGGVAACQDDVHQFDFPPPQGGAIQPAVEDDAGIADAGTDDDDDDDDDDRPTKAPTKQPTKQPTKANRPPADDNGDDDNSGDDDGDDGDDGDDDDPEPRPDDREPEPEPDLPPVAGTSGPAGCYSYTAPSDGMCGGHYCGITEEQLRAEMPDDSVCGDPEFACSGNLVSVSGACARQVKGNMPFASNDALRPAIVSCVNEDAEIAERVPSACLTCFLDALDCVSQACLVECLNGDSPQCDRCAQNAGCFDPVFTCGGLPNPN